MNSAVLSQAWRSMKTPLGRPGSLIATLTVVTALPAVGVIFISGSAQNRPVMVTVFMVFPLWWVAVGQNVLRGKGGASREARRAEGEVLVGPVTVSERSERRQKLVRALMPGGPEHHLGSSDPRPGEDHRTSSGPAGRPKVGTRCTPQSTSPTQRSGQVGRSGEWTIVLGHGEHPATATRRVARPARPDPNQVSPRGAHRRRAPTAALHWRPTPSRPWPQRKGGSPRGAVAAPVPRPGRLQCHAASAPWCRGDLPGRLCL